MRASTSHSRSDSDVLHTRLLPPPSLRHPPSNAHPRCHHLHHHHATATPTSRPCWKRGPPSPYAVYKVEAIKAHHHFSPGVVCCGISASIEKQCTLSTSGRTSASCKGLQKSRMLSADVMIIMARILVTRCCQTCECARQRKIDVTDACDVAMAFELCGAQG